MAVSTGQVDYEASHHRDGCAISQASARTVKTATTSRPSTPRNCGIRAQHLIYDQKKSCYASSHMSPDKKNGKCLRSALRPKNKSPKGLIVHTVHPNSLFLSVSLPFFLHLVVSPPLAFFSLSPVKRTWYLRSVAHTGFFFSCLASATAA